MLEITLALFNFEKKRLIPTTVMLELCLKSYLTGFKPTVRPFKQKRKSNELSGTFAQTNVNKTLCAKKVQICLKSVPQKTFDVRIYCCLEFSLPEVTFFMGR